MSTRGSPRGSPPPGSCQSLGLSDNESPFVGWLTLHPCCCFRCLLCPVDDGQDVAPQADPGGGRGDDEEGDRRGRSGTAASSSSSCPALRCRHHSPFLVFGRLRSASSWHPPTTSSRLSTRTVSVRLPRCKKDSSRNLSAQLCSLTKRRWRALHGAVDGRAKCASACIRPELAPLGSSQPVVEEPRGKA